MAFISPVLLGGLFFKGLPGSLSSFVVVTWGWPGFIQGSLFLSLSRLRFTIGVIWRICGFF